jgi:gamma-glutamyltranspeptidase/glutathione hydrolase
MLREPTLPEARVRTIPRRHTIASASAVLVACALLAYGPIRANAAFPPSAEGKTIAAATDNDAATDAALEAMTHGGNAADGAIAATLTLGVVSPLASGLGGGGFALVYSARDHKVTAIDFRESAPQNVSVEGLVAREGREIPEQRGVSIGVPGEPAGLEWLSKHYAKRSLADDAARAASLAEHGAPLGRNLADQLNNPYVRSRLRVAPEIEATFLPQGRAPGYGTQIRREALAKTIKRFGAEGARAFYTGDIAMKIIDSAKAVGSPLEPSDLAAYKVIEREPLTRTIDGKTIYAMPAPSAGGLMLLEVLSMYGASPSSPLRAMGFGSSAQIHMVAEAMRGAVADRARFAGDPSLDPEVNAAFERALDPAQIAARRARIDPNKTLRAAEFKTREHGTSHLIITDSEGNIVSLTTTVNGAFGARVVAGDSGIVLNNELDDFSTPGEIGGFGLIGLGPNRPRGNARPVSSMTPAIVLENNEPILAIGGSGGERIATGVTQAAIARLVFELDPSACVGAPRVHVNSAADMVVDSDIPEDVLAGLRARGETIKVSAVGVRPAVQMMAWERGPNGTRILAASDPRKMGFSAAQ